MKKRKYGIIITGALAVLIICFIGISIVGPSDKLLIDNSTIWSYYDGETDPVENDDRTAWTEKDFDIRQWKDNSGHAAKFGAIEGQLNKITGHMPEVLLKQYKSGTEDNIEAYFFRTTFEAGRIPDNYILKGHVFYDDAALIYLNGELIADFENKQHDDYTKDFDKNMQYGGRGAGVTDGIFKVDAGLLKKGENIIAVEIHQVSRDSNDIYFEMPSLTLEKFKPEQDCVALTVGEDETSRNITWYYNEEIPGIVQYALKDGNSFPDKFKEVKAEMEPTNRGYMYSNKAVLSDLEPDAEYVYRVINGECMSDMYSFSTTGEGDYEFLIVGDAQLGDTDLDKEAAAWENTLNKAAEKYPDAAFIMSTGDQVDNAANELHYDAFLENEIVKSIPLSTNIGNHDADSYAYSQHFYLPNVTEYGITEAGSDYWFVYNNTLFMNMNSNNNNVDEHEKFIREAIAQNPDVEWKIVSLHHSVFSAARHAQSDQVIEKRNLFVPMLSEFDIDVVFMGHDHVYVRSYIMEGDKPKVTDKVRHSADDPEGILYMTMNSSSGSKFYDITDDYRYAAVTSQEFIPNVTQVKVTDDSFKITVHRVDEDMSVLDHFTLYN